jgi:quercetin dioxygenase-like cupin family protein
VPRAGDRYVMPDGGQYVLVKSHEETGGEYVEMEWRFPPGVFTPPAHIHPTQVEEYEVLDGKFEVMVDGEWRELGPGDSASVPPNTDHTFRTIPGHTVHVRNFHRPGGRFDEFVEKQYRFVNSEKFKGIKRPSTMIVMSMAWREHADLLVPSSRPLRWAMAGLARLGGLLGYRTQ